MSDKMDYEDKNIIELAKIMLKKSKVPRRKITEELINNSAKFMKKALKNIITQQLEYPHEPFSSISLFYWAREVNRPYFKIMFTHICRKNNKRIKDEKMSTIAKNIMINKKLQKEWISNTSIEVSVIIVTDALYIIMHKIGLMSKIKRFIGSMMCY